MELDGCKASTAMSIKEDIMSRRGVECANMWWGECHLNLMIALMVMMFVIFDGDDDDVCIGW